MSNYIHLINDINIVGGAEKMVERICKRSNHSYLSIRSGFFNWVPTFLHLLIFKDTIFVLHLFPTIYISILIPKNRVFLYEHNTWNRRRKYKTFSLIEKPIYRACKRIICISSAVEWSLEEWLGIDNISVIPNFSRFDKEKRYYFARSSMPLKICMVGAFSDQKRQDLLVEAISYIEFPVEVYFCGDGKNLKSVQDLCRKYKLEDKVRFLGNVDPRPYYKECSLNVLLSNWEGFGLVVIEGYSFGLPALVSDVDGLKDLAISDNYVVENDPIKIAENITILKDDAPDFSMIEKLVDKYSFSSYIKNLESL